MKTYINRAALSGILWGVVGKFQFLSEFIRSSGSNRFVLQKFLQHLQHFHLQSGDTSFVLVDTDLFSSRLAFQIWSKTLSVHYGMSESSKIAFCVAELELVSLSSYLLLCTHYLLE